MNYFDLIFPNQSSVLKLTESNRILTAVITIAWYLWSLPNCDAIRSSNGTTRIVGTHESKLEN